MTINVTTKGVLIVLTVCIIFTSGIIIGSRYSPVHTAFALGYYEEKDVWNRIRVDEHGQVICTTRNGEK